MGASEILRVSAAELSVERFLADYVSSNRPVIVTGALHGWNIAVEWTPDTLERRFGARLVPVYNSHFDLQGIVPLGKYFATYFEKLTQERNGFVPYVRWYTKLRDVEFCWADDTFDQLRASWRHPVFLPDGDYLLPFSPPGTATSPVKHHFPAKGLFISPRGARTGLHVDPWASCAILCQLYGYKTWYFYGPEQAKYLCAGRDVVDATRPDLQRFPMFRHAKLTATCILAPGEVIYVPHGWYHQVECDSDSISLTWNFVHRTTAASLIQWLHGSALSEFDLSVLRFFYALPEGSDVVGRVLDSILNT